MFQLCSVFLVLGDGDDIEPARPSRYFVGDRELGTGAAGISNIAIVVPGRLVRVRAEVTLVRSGAAGLSAHFILVTADASGRPGYPAHRAVGMVHFIRG